MVVERSRDKPKRAYLCDLENKKDNYMPYMYILKCADNSYYTGSTKDLEIRLKQHQNGEGANYTKKHLPVELVYFEEYDRIDDAFYREKQVQGWSRKKKEALINGDAHALHLLAECKNSTNCKKVTSSRLCGISVHASTKISD
jgi:predicted GIY-YIG superfamily endonuclease